MGRIPVAKDTRKLLASTLRRTSGDRRKAAALLGVHKATLHRWLLAYPDIALRYPPTTQGRPKGAKDRKPRSRFCPFFVPVLGLPWPFTQEQLVAAWRKSVALHHPDKGGSHEAFVRVKLAYDAAKPFAI